MSTAVRGTSRRRVPRGGHGSRYRKGDNLFGYIFIGPWLVGFITLTLIPVISVLFLGFTRYSMFAPPHWIGATNFIQMFTTDTRYWASVRATLYFAFVSVPLKLIFALAVAMVLATKHRFVGAYRAIYYTPSIIGASVAIAVVWRQIFASSGLVNYLLAMIHITVNISWIGDPRTAIWTLIILVVWQFGSPMLIFLAGLKQIPAELYECAAIDGARFWGKFFHITLPLLTPIIFFNFVLQMIFGLTVFTQAFIVTGGAPLDTTNFYALYLFQKAFSDFQMGYGSAMAFILLVTVAAFTALVFRSSPYWVFYQTEVK
ncbi:MAG TPA: sugar ABC transporter permease [Spirochaetia bacterium]|nr:sugar ABC transporter permease [Spirochaetia bacterium]